ncbi:hypothetical protein B0H10DRAFT_2218297 [Mycena sp. CBHHK59/15]|nr:hypothetical protein B0H10DRAFT_2218297 [Mycena sp. CBHHK59/15]
MSLFLLPPPPRTSPLRGDAQLPISQVIPIKGVSAARLTGAFVAMRQREGKTQRQVHTNPPLQPRTRRANEELPAYRDVVRSDVSQVPDVRAEVHLVRAGNGRSWACLCCTMSCGVRTQLATCERRVGSMDTVRVGSGPWAAAAPTT